MTEYELTDVMYNIFSNMNEAAVMYFTLVSAYIGMSFLIGKKLTRFQLVIINVLYITWVIGVINTVYSGLANALEVTQALDSMNAIITNQGSEIISISIYSFMAVQFGGIIASLLFMWSVRHPNSE